MYRNLLGILRLVRFTLACVSLSLLLTGCLTVASVLNPEYPQGNKPLAYYDWVKTIGSDELIAEQKRLEALVTVNDEVIPIIQLSLSLTVVSNSGDRRNIDRAIALLESIDLSCVSSPCPSYILFGELWHGLLLQRREFGTAIATNLESDEELEILRGQVNKLRQQIEALTSIEQQLIEREQPQIQQ